MGDPPLDKLLFQWIFEPYPRVISEASKASVNNFCVYLFLIAFILAQLITFSQYMLEIFVAEFFPSFSWKEWCWAQRKEVAATIVFISDRGKSETGIKNTGSGSRQNIARKAESGSRACMPSYDTPPSFQFIIVKHKRKRSKNRSVSRRHSDFGLRHPPSRMPNSDSGVIASESSMETHGVFIGQVSIRVKSGNALHASTGIPKVRANVHRRLSGR